MIFQILLLSLLCLGIFFELLNYLCRQEEILDFFPKELIFYSHDFQT